MSAAEFDFQAKEQLMAIRVAVVTGSSSGSSKARDDATATAAMVSKHTKTTPKDTHPQGFRQH